MKRCCSAWLTRTSASPTGTRSDRLFEPVPHTRSEGFVVLADAHRRNRDPPVVDGPDVGAFRCRCTLRVDAPVHSHSRARTRAFSERLGTGTYVCLRGHAVAFV